MSRGKAKKINKIINNWQKLMARQTKVAQIFDLFVSCI